MNFNNVWFSGNVEGRGNLRWRRAFIVKDLVPLVLFLLFKYGVVLTGLGQVGGDITWSKTEAALDLTNLCEAFMLMWAVLKISLNLMYLKYAANNYETWNTDESPVPVAFRVMWACYVIGVPLTVTNAFVYIIHVAPGPMQTRPPDMFMVRAFVQALFALLGLFITREPFIPMQIVWPVGVIFVYDVFVSIVYGDWYPKSHFWIGFGICIVVYGIVQQLEEVLQMKLKGYVFFHASELTAEDIRRLNAQTRDNPTAEPTHDVETAEASDEETRPPV